MADQGQEQLPLDGGNNGGDGSTARPDWLPESYWDATAGAPKADDLKGVFGEIGGLREFKTAREAELAALPKDPTEYKIDLPEGFQVPEGQKFQVDYNQPLVRDARAWAAKHKIPQGALTDLVGIFASSQLADLTAMTEFEAGETKALGANADARKKAVTDWASGIVGKDKAAILGPLLKTKAGVEAFETIMSKMGGVQMRGQPSVDKQPKPGEELAEKVGQPGTGAALLRAANSASH